MKFGLFWVDFGLQGWTFWTCGLLKFQLNKVLNTFGGFNNMYNNNVSFLVYLSASVFVYRNILSLMVLQMRTFISPNIQLLTHTDTHTHTYIFLYKWALYKNLYCNWYIISHKHFSLLLSSALRRDTIPGTIYYLPFLQYGGTWFQGPNTVQNLPPILWPQLGPIP